MLWTQYRIIFSCNANSMCCRFACKLSSPSNTTFIILYTYTYHNVYINLENTENTMHVGSGEHFSSYSEGIAIHFICSCVYIFYYMECFSTIDILYSLVWNKKLHWKSHYFIYIFDYLYVLQPYIKTKRRTKNKHNIHHFYTPIVEIGGYSNVYIGFTPSTLNARQLHYLAYATFDEKLFLPFFPSLKFTLINLANIWLISQIWLYLWI